MSTTIPCLKGKLGSTEYYVVKMKAGVLINTVGYAEQIPEWRTMDIEERMQRELNEKRVIDEIVPYIVNDPNMFFGSLIVDIYKGWDSIQFESVIDICSKMPRAYSDNADEIGFITIPDNMSLIALDGQHRLLSLNVAIKGWMGLIGGSKISEDIKNELQPHPDLVDEDVTVILVPHTDNKKIRSIFNKVNRYAKQTSRGDNIITSEDDIFAIIARRLMKVSEPLQPINNQYIVNWSSNTLSAKSKQLTTISVLYTFAEELLKDDKSINKNQRPNDDIIDEKYEKVSLVWRYLLEHLDSYTEYLSILSEENNTSKNVATLREESLLFKPVTQMAIAIAIKLAEAKGVNILEIITKLNKIDWSFDSNTWQGILVMKGTKKVFAGKDAIRNAGRIISYMVAGDKYTPQEQQDLLETITKASGDQRQLPTCID